MVLLLRTLLAPPFRIWPTPEPGSWQSLTFWSLFRGGMIATFVVAVLDWNSTPLLDWTRFIPRFAAWIDRPVRSPCAAISISASATPIAAPTAW